MHLKGKSVLPEPRWREIEMSKLVKSLRDRTALKYMGNCKCMNCQLMPRPMIDAVADRIEALEAALRSIIVHCEVPAPPNVEALKKRENQLKKVLKLNKFEKQNIININQPIDISAKKVNFYNGKTHEWFGQSITINDHKINKIKNFFNRILNKNNILYNLNTITLENIINDEIIDLCLMDIQGLELDLIDKNIDLIKKKIKYLIIGTHGKNTEMSRNKDNHTLLLNLINKINFDIQFECEEKEIKNFYGINITCGEDGIIVAKNKEYNDL
jgi:hypothetical protein